MKYLIAVLAVLTVSFSVMGQDMGTISPDTLIPAKQIVQPAQFTGAYYEYTYSGDSSAKYNDKLVLKFWNKRAGTTSAFDSNFVIIQPKTRGLDTLNNRRGYIWRVRLELLPR